MKLREFLNEWKGNGQFLIGTDMGDGYGYWHHGNGNDYCVQSCFLERKVKRILLREGMIKDQKFNGVCVIIEGDEDGDIYFT